MEVLKLQKGSSTDDVSFHYATIEASPAQLYSLFGQPTWDNNDGSDKVNYCWELELEDGTVFTIYDWKKYRPIGRDELVDWHIGHEDEADKERLLIHLINYIYNNL